MPCEGLLVRIVFTVPMGPKQPPRPIDARVDALAVNSNSHPDRSQNLVAQHASKMTRDVQQLGRLSFDPREVLLVETFSQPNLHTEYLLNLTGTESPSHVYGIQPGPRPLVNDLAMRLAQCIAAGLDQLAMQATCRDPGLVWPERGGGTTLSLEEMGRCWTVMVQHEFHKKRGVKSSRPAQPGPKRSYDTRYKIGLITARLTHSMGPTWHSYTVPAAIATIKPAGGNFPRELVRKAKLSELEAAAAIVPKLLLGHREILIQIDNRHAHDPAACIRDDTISYLGFDNSGQSPRPLHLPPPHHDIPVTDFAAEPTVSIDSAALFTNHDLEAFFAQCVDVIGEVPLEMAEDVLDADFTHNRALDIGSL
nr:hypothetical protein B0A51_03363 [Rachicladosporium sp. CCFEE 5018]